MSKKISRKDDTNTTGGKIVRGAKTVFAENKPVGLHKSDITPHDPRSKSPHKKAKTTEGSPTVFAENCPVLRVGSGNTCGHKIKTGAGTVFVP